MTAATCSTTMTATLACQLTPHMKPAPRTLSSIDAHHLATQAVGATPDGPNPTRPQRGNNPATSSDHGVPTHVLQAWPQLPPPTATQHALPAQQQCCMPSYHGPRHRSVQAPQNNSHDELTQEVRDPQAVLEQQWVDAAHVTNTQRTDHQPRTSHAACHRHLLCPHYLNSDTATSQETNPGCLHASGSIGTTAKMIAFSWTVTSKHTR